MIETTKEAASRLTRAVNQSARDNDGWPGESDDAVNDACRDVIHAMADNGEAWLGDINLSRLTRQGPVANCSPTKGGCATPETVLYKWNGSLVYNFGCSFVTPCFDMPLAKLILERDAAPYTTADEDYKRIDAIMNRIVEIGGVHLFWT